MLKLEEKLGTTQNRKKSVILVKKSKHQNASSIILHYNNCTI